MNPPRVSVVIAAYNGAACIAQTLAHVQAQQFTDWELLVVDDGSDDGTADVVRQTAPTARLLQTARLGVCGARNRGLASARGELICFLDQDDLWYPPHLRTHVACLDARPAWGAVFGPYRFWYPALPGEDALPQHCPEPPDPIVDPTMNGWIYHQLLEDCHALTSATTLRRELLLRHGGFDERWPFAEDWELWLRLSRHVQFARLTWPPVLYRQHPTQGSRSSRDIDYRTRLLDASVRRWGLSSPDGRALDAGRFRHRLARYQMAFGRGHLQRGRRWLGVRSLLSAWRRDPVQLRWLALALAGAAGYRPAPDPWVRGHPNA